MRAALRRLIRLPFLVAILAVWASAVLAQAPGTGSSGVTPPLVARSQLHSNGLRGSVYISRSRESATVEPSTVPFRAVTRIPYDGDGTVNARGNLYPIDVDGDGTYEFLHFNGFRMMRVYRQDGTKLWQADNPAGRLHSQLKNRDTLSVLDVDGDGSQEIIHCWAGDGERSRALVLRDGTTGAVRRSVRLNGQPASVACQIATFWMDRADEPVVLVAGRVTDGSCARNFTDTYSHVAAFTPALKPLWERNTCDAGHYAWPLDENGDGRAEAVFIGKYQYGADGRLRCILPGYTNDHVDSMVVTDFDPMREGYEALTAGQFGTRFYRAQTCSPIWSRGSDLVRNAQHVAAARTAPDQPPVALITQKPQEPGASSYLVTTEGSARRLYAAADDPLLVQVFNANVDGAPAAEDRVAHFAQVIDGETGKLRLSRDWYWGLQTVSAAEARLPLNEQWAEVPVVLDLDGDGSDEIVTWGRDMIVVGSGRGGGGGNGGGGGDDDGGSTGDSGGFREKTPNKDGRDNAVRQR